MATTGSRDSRARRGKRFGDGKGVQVREDALARLEAGIRQLTSSDEWKKYLRVQAKFRRYSFFNTMLIATQCPEATQVMSFGNKEGTTGWKSLGRRVKGPDPVTGERQHAIYIYAPTHRKVVTHNEETGEDEESKKLGGFMLVPVFDVSQTEGDPLPEPVKLLEGEDNQRAYSRLKDVAARWGFDVVDVDDSPPGCPGANGACEHSKDGKGGTIYVVRDRSPLQRVKTLAHELVHAQLHRPDQVNYGSERPRCELEAESGAFVVLDANGLDSGDYSFGYVAGWQQGKTADQIKEALKRSGDAIGCAARAILDELDKAQAEATEPGEVDTVASVA